LDWLQVLKSIVEVTEYPKTLGQSSGRHNPIQSMDGSNLCQTLWWLFWHRDNGVGHIISTKLSYIELGYHCRDWWPTLAGLPFPYFAG